MGLVRDLLPGYAESIHDARNEVVLFEKLPRISLYSGLLEKSDNIMAVQLEWAWANFSDFKALEAYAHSPNLSENVTSVGSANNFVVSEINGKETVLVGMEDTMIVDTRDVLLIAKRGEEWKIAEAMRQIEAKNVSLIDSQKTKYKPWGMSVIIEEWPTYKAKRLIVNPEQKIALQTHLQRVECWSVVAGVARVTIGTESKYLQRGESVNIPIWVPHRLENPGKTSLVVMETQIGDYLGDDDVVRFGEG